MNDSKILKSSLVHPSGHKMVLMGGLIYGEPMLGTNGLYAEFKWVDGEPVMVIFKRTLGNTSKGFMIEMADAHKFAMSNGYATRALTNEYARLAADALGEMNDRSLGFSIITMILDGIPVLLNMPPEPSEQEIANRLSSGNDEISIKVDGKTVLEMQV